MMKSDKKNLMNNKFILIVVLSILCSHTQAQVNEPASIKVVCANTNRLDKNNLSYILEIANSGVDTLEMRNKIIAGPITGLRINLGYEILFCIKGDSIDVLKQIGIDIDAFGDAQKSIVKLAQNETRLIKVSVPKIFFREKGNYLIRFVLKKGFLRIRHLDINENIYSDWYKFNQ